MAPARFILAINPGSTSTRIALYRDEDPVFSEKSDLEPGETETPLERQLEGRLRRIEARLREALPPGAAPSAIVGRGGILRPLRAGTYRVCDRMLAELSAQARGEHPSNMGGILARRVAEAWGVPAFVVDPVTVDEFLPVSRIAGHPRMTRKSLSHALNMKAVARRVAREEGRRYEELNLITAHLGGGISVAPHRRGRMIDVNNANEQGPFSPERSGGLPVLQLVEYCFGEFQRGRTARDLRTELTRRSGLFGLLGDKDLPALLARADEKTRTVLEAMAYQIAREIGAAGAALRGAVDFVILTGGMAASEWLVGEIRDRVAFLAPLRVVPGENELESLALGALRVLRGEETPRDYGEEQDGQEF